MSINATSLKELVQTLLEAIRTENEKNKGGDSDIRNKEIYTLDEAAKYLSISKHTLRKYAKAGTIRRSMVGVKKYFFHIDEMKRFCTDYRGL